MNNRTFAVATLLACTSLAQAQFVKGNEAVQVTPTGKLVQTPPVPRTASRVCAAKAGCHAGAWRMVETDAGLRECTEPWARPTSCRDSTFGASKLRRVWVVKTGGMWAQCQRPDLSSHCTPMFARPPENMPRDALQ